MRRWWPADLPRTACANPQGHAEPPSVSCHAKPWPQALSMRSQVRGAQVPSMRSRVRGAQAPSMRSQVRGARLTCGYVGPLPDAVRAGASARCAESSAEAYAHTLSPSCARGKAPPGQQILWPKRGGFCAICYALHATCHMSRATCYLPLMPHVQVVCVR